MILDTLFGEGQTGLKVLFILIVVLVVLALAFWLLRRFGGGRLGGAATRGRQPRLAVIDQAAVDSRRSLVLIRRDNVEHLLIIGGPTDVVVEQNIVRAAAAVVVPARPATATDTLPRAVPLGDDSMWPLQPEAAPKLEPAPKLEAAPKPEPAARIEPTLRPDAASRPQRPSATVDESTQWPGEEAAPVLPPPVAPPVVTPRERKARASDPLAELAEELSRTAIPPDATGAEPPRRAPRLQPAPPAAPPPPAAADAPSGPAPDQNLSEMAQRLEAALRRPAKGADKGALAKPEDKPEQTGEAAAAGPEEFAPAPGPRLEPTLRRPFRTDDDRPAPPLPKAEPAAEGGEPPPPRFGAAFRRPLRADDSRAARPAPKVPGEAGWPEQDFAPAPLPPRPGAPRRPFIEEGRASPPAPKPASEPTDAETEESPAPGAPPQRGAAPQDPARPAPRGAPEGTDAKPAPQRSLYDSLEQEMASLLNRPPKP
jgi:flagellar protein FliO/FliZ